MTYWDGVGAYTKDDVRVLCVCLSKYEIEELLHMVHSVDPHAFFDCAGGVRVFGNFRGSWDEERRIAMNGPIAVLAGTPVDTRMGVAYLEERGLPGVPFPLSRGPREQLTPTASAPRPPG